MNYLYNKQEIDFAEYIRDNPPKNIWWSFTAYVFDYEEFYFQIECVSEVADTPNGLDEAIVGRFTKYLYPFNPKGDTKLICENKKIEELYVLRVFLYYTTFESFSIKEQMLNVIKQRIKRFLNRKQYSFEDIISSPTGYCEEITCHPDSEEALNVESKFSNLVDCGLLIKIDGKYLKAFVEDCFFGFHIYNDKYFFEKDEIKELSEQYKFIKI